MSDRRLSKKPEQQGRTCHMTNKYLFYKNWERKGKDHLLMSPVSASLSKEIWQVEGQNTRHL